VRGAWHGPKIAGKDSLPFPSMISCAAVPVLNFWHKTLEMREMHGIWLAATEKGQDLARVFE
jgi:hypothetical protein